MRTIDTIILHHSAGRTTATPDDLRRYHTAPPPNGRGWSDVGYHWIVYEVATEGTWAIGQGRPESRVGAHDEGQNATSIGVCVCGDYTKGPLSVGALLALTQLLVDLCRRHGLTAIAIEGHGEHEPSSTPTACPGFDPFIVRDLVAAALALTAASAA